MCIHSQLEAFSLVTTLVCALLVLLHLFDTYTNAIEHTSLCVEFLYMKVLFSLCDYARFSPTKIGNSILDQSWHSQALYWIASHFLFHESCKIYNGMTIFYYHFIQNLPKKNLWLCILLFHFKSSYDFQGSYTANNRFDCETKNTHINYILFI